MKSTTVYVFDHASGFDWNIDRDTIERERDEYRDAGWITECDSIHRIDVPVELVTGVNNEQITDYLEGEDWSALGGVLLWTPSPGEAQQEA